MMGTLTDLADAVIFTYDFIFTSFRYILDFNYILVSFLLKTASSIVAQLCLIVNLLGSAILTALEDFHAFLLDIFTGIALISHLFEELIRFIHESFIYIVNEVKETLTDINIFAKSTITSLVLLIEASLEFFYDLLCLALRSLVLLLQMFPYSLIFVINLIKFTIVAIGKGVSSFLNSLILGIINSLVSTVTFLHCAVIQIPYDAYAGLVIAMAMYALFKCHRSGIITFPPLFSQFCTKLLTYSNLVWSILISCCRKMKPKKQRQTVNTPAILPCSSDEKSDNIQSLRKELERQKEQNQCIICQTEPKSVVLLPCKHMCLCIDCCNTLFETRSTCPLCRRRVLNPIAVYT